MKKMFSIVATLVAAAFVSAAAVAQTPNITGNTFQTQQAGKTVQGMVGMCIDASNNAVPCGSGGTGAATTITGSSAFGPVAPGAPTATSSDLMGCRFNSTANDTTANDQGAVGCDQRGGLYVQDGKAIPSASLTSTGTLLLIPDTAGYGSISVQVTSAGVGATITYQVSQDGATWSSGSCYPPNANGSTSATSTSTTATTLLCATPSKQFRAQITAYVSGTVTAEATLRKDTLPKQSMQVGFLQAIGSNQVGGYDKFVTSTPTVQNAAYSAANAIGGLQSISYFRGNGGTGILNNISMWSKGGSTTPITLYLFQSNPTGTTCTDKVAFSLGAADISKIVAGGPIVLQPIAVVGTTATNASIQLPISVQNNESTSTIYGCAVVGGSGFTPASTSDLIFNFSGITD